MIQNAEEWAASQAEAARVDGVRRRKRENRRLMASVRHCFWPEKSESYWSAEDALEASRAKFYGLEASTIPTGIRWGLA